jgi:hypothetical protein
MGAVRPPGDWYQRERKYALPCKTSLVPILLFNEIHWRNISDFYVYVLSFDSFLVRVFFHSMGLSKIIYVWLLYFSYAGGGGAPALGLLSNTARYQRSHVGPNRDPEFWYKMSSGVGTTTFRECECSHERPGYRSTFTALLKLLTPLFLQIIHRLHLASSSERLRKSN